MSGVDKALEAAARAMRDAPRRATYDGLARAAIEAALPELERQIRQRVAGEIETEAQAALELGRTHSPREQAAYRAAAHIARGGACVANPKGVGGGGNGQA